MMRSTALIALGLAALAACSPSSPHTAAADTVASAPMAVPQPELAPVPDAEADSIPTVAGIPIVPITATVANLVAAPKIVRKKPASFNTNDIGLAIIRESETLQLKAYELGGVWLIGYGHLMLEGEKDVITEAEAEAFLEQDLHWCEGALERMVSTSVTENEFSAVAAFCYNVGSGKTRGSSIVRKLNADDREGAANSFLLWNRMNGEVKKALAERRARERTLFLTP
jgi:lysozyme